MIDQSRAIAEMNATGVVYTPRECAEGLYALTHTFRVYIYFGVGIHTLFVFERAFIGPKWEQAGEDTPLFRIW